MKKLDFVIIGAQKSSSTFLQTLINEHPEAFLPKDEIPYFESDAHDLGPEIYFEELFSKSQAISHGIKRPNYLGITGVEKRLHAHNPNIKAIAVLRNPIDRVISAYFHYIRDGFLPVLEINRGLEEIFNNPEFLKKYPRAIEIIEFGFYYKHIARYNKYFKASNMKIFLHEDVLSMPLDVAKGSYKFLGLNESYVPKRIRSRPQSVVYNYKRVTMLRYLNIYTSKYSDDSMRVMGKKSLLHRCLFYSYKQFDGYILSKISPNSKPVLTDSMFNRLIEIYSKDIESLSILLNRDLSHWLIKK